MLVSEEGKVIYILAKERKEFDRINQPVMDFREFTGENKKNLLTKTVETPETTVIFQHWLEVDGE